MRPNHHQFIAFAYVVREGSFSAAAQRLGVTQSTVTQHVAKLEANIGAQLLIRARDGINVTNAGRELYDLADRLVALDTAISEKLDGFASMKAGRITVIANAPQPALGIIAEFKALYPGIHVEFGLHDWTTATAMLRGRLADVGLITDAPQSSDWERQLLHRVRYVAHCRADEPLAAAPSISLADLAHCTVILPESGSLTRKVVDQKLSALGLTLGNTVTMTTFPVMCEAVLQGIGVAIFLNNSTLISDGLAEVPIKEFTQVHETWLVSTKDRSKLRLVAEFTAVAMSMATAVHQ